MERKQLPFSEAATRSYGFTRSKLVIASGRLLLSCVALVAWAGLGIAADLIPPSPPPYVVNWTGCYIGGHGGYGVANSNSFYSSPASPVLDVNGFFTAALFIQKFDNRGFAGGGQVGCQQQTGAYLWGLEGDWSSFTNSSSHNFSSSFDEGGGVTFRQSFDQSLGYSWLWSVRGRFGIVFSDVYHVYVTAGVGGARTNYAYSGSFSETGGGGCVCGSVAGNVRINPTGLVVGAGAEWKAWSNFIVGVEYLHYDLTSDTVIPFNTASLNPLIALGDHVHTKSVDLVRVRLSLLLNLGR